MKAPKKPKLLSVPKQPKANASKTTWDNYDKKVKQIQSENTKRINAYKAEEKKFQAEIQKRDKIKDNARKAKSQLSGF